jgi:hypothetical protein
MPIKLEVLEIKLGPKDMPITCETDECFETAKWFIDGFAHCQECKNRIVKKFSENIDPTPVCSDYVGVKPDKKSMFWEWVRWQAQSYKAWPDSDWWCTCHACMGHWNCEFAGDTYNTDEDCLALK